MWAHSVVSVDAFTRPFVNYLFVMDAHNTFNDLIKNTRNVCEREREGEKERQTETLILKYLKYLYNWWPCCCCCKASNSFGFYYNLFLTGLVLLHSTPQTPRTLNLLDNNVFNEQSTLIWKCPLFIGRFLLKHMKIIIPHRQQMFLDAFTRSLGVLSLKATICLRIS